jgi:predicted Zn-dependent protease
MRKLIYVTLLFAICAAPASAQFGELLKRGKQAKQVSDAAKPWTAEQEIAIGEASAAKLVAVLGLYDNPEMTHYVSTVGQALATHTSRPMEYKFGILNTGARTAFGMPGGYVFITAGALNNMKNEAELAGVLAHEIAHVDNRHLEKEVVAKKTTGALSQIGFEEGFDQLGGGRVPFGGYLEKLGAQVVTAALTQSYSRDKEDEADRKGTEIAAATGYDANGLKNFLTMLKEMSDKNPDAQKQSNGLWGSTHPSFADRIAALTPIAANFPGGATNDDRFKKEATFAPAANEAVVHEAPVPKPAETTPASGANGTTAKTVKSKAKVVPKSK